MKEIKVWDFFVRAFHWSLVLFYLVAFATGDEEDTIHTYAGYVIITLLLSRVIWGFIGTYYARFKSFVFPPSAILGYLRDITTLRAKRYLGHNPLGGAMVVALIVILLLTGLTGLAALGAADHTGPLSFIASWPRSVRHMLEELHESFAYLSLVMVFAHVTGVFFESYLHQENLIKAMVTGKKRIQISNLKRW